MAGAMNARRSAKTARLSGTGREGVVYRPAIFAAMIAALLGAPATAAESVGVVTILEGDAITIRGLSDFALAEGVRVSSNDLVETGKSTFRSEERRVGKEGRLL